MVRIYEYQHPDWGIVFKKIRKAFRDYAPIWVEWVDRMEDSDIQIVHIVGLGEVEVALKAKNLVLFQECYKTAGNYAWDTLWETSLLTVSFYDLPKETDKKFNFLYLPFGYDPNIYYNFNDYSRANLVFATGHIAETEHLDKIYRACKRAKYLFIHTGEDFKFGELYLHLEYMSEVDFRNLLNQVSYVFGLRAVEGFEVAVLEGIACGATGVVPTLPSYDWYDELAIRIDIESPNLEENIYNILKNKERIAVNKEKLAQFSWANIMRRFYNELWQLLKE
jgi:hypothetical protein